MNIYSAFEETAIRNPNTIAIIEGKKSITYGSLLRQINGEALRLQRKGIGAGDRILVFVPMGISLYRTVLAIFKIGAVAVFLDEWTSLKRLRLCCRLADCKAMMSGRKLRVAAYLFSETRRISVRISPQVQEVENAPTLDVSAEHPALITFTTGSTGTPKAALRSHGFLAAQRAALRAEVHPAIGEAVMTTLPVVLLLNLAAGATSVIADFNQRKPETMRPERIFEQLKKHQVRQIIASPFFVQSLAKKQVSQRQGLNLHKILTGGAPVFPADARLFLEAFPKAEIYVAYGSTEAEPISVINAKELAKAEDSAKNYGVPVGQIHDEIKLKIIEITDENLNAYQQFLQEVEQGNIGEIIVAGEHVLRHYFKNEAAWQRNKIPDGNNLWHRTGDSGRIGKDGKLYLTGRCASYLELGQDTYSPFLTEYALAQHPDIVEGTPLVKNGKTIFCICVKDNAQEEEIQAYILREFPKASGVRFFDKLPKDPRHHSKIDYGKLGVAVVLVE